MTISKAQILEAFMEDDKLNESDLKSLNLALKIRADLENGRRPMIAFKYLKKSGDVSPQAIDLFDDNAHLVLVSKFDLGGNGIKISGKDFLRPDLESGSPCSFRHFFLDKMSNVTVTGYQNIGG